LTVEQAEAQIILQMPAETADIIMKALKPETDTPSSNRSRAVIKKGFNGVIIYVSASDTTALRASINSYMRWVQGIVDVVNRIR